MKDKKTRIKYQCENGEIIYIPYDVYFNSSNEFFENYVQSKCDKCFNDEDKYKKFNFFDDNDEDYNIFI
ncbi:MAG: hypothetical protein KatS3mg002_1588 [Candidatus Woesearchaeota archaeon]|nr:MAG: hypothetical protein KatS3mg002_1588 [Candidatus Woesearchaeota archaeon]